MKGMTTSLTKLRLGTLLTVAVAVAVVTAGCRGGSTLSSSTTAAPSTTMTASNPAVGLRETTSTTTPPPADRRLLAAADLGVDFVDEPYPSKVQGPCLLALPDAHATTERLSAGYVSNAALERATIELLVHADATSASVAYAAARRDSACTGEENRDDGAPRAADIAGAAEAFSIGYADPNDGTAVTVARTGRTLVVAAATFHFGVATSDGVSSDDLATRAVDRLG